jgi:polysaccharide biosynthesis protein PslE
MKKSPAGFLKAPNINLRDVAGSLFRRKWLILVTLLTTVTATGVFAWLTPDKYESRMKLLVKNMRSDTPVTTGNGSVLDNNEISESQIVSQIELLKSRDLLEDVVKQTNLAQPETNGAEVSDKDIEKAIYKLEKELHITPVKKANIIEISYSSKSPETAALVLNKLAELFLEKHLKLHRPPGTSDFFKAQAEQYQQDLRQAENRFSNFQQQKGAVEINRQKELTLTKLSETSSRLKDLDGKIQEADKRIAAIEKQLGGMERRVATQSRVIPNQYSVERLNTMLVELRNRRIQLLAKFQPDDRVVKEVDEQIQQTTEALQKVSQTTAVEQASDLNPLRQSLETELANVRIDQAGHLALRKNLLEQVQQNQDKLTKLAGVTTIHDDLSRQVKQTEETYQLYARKQEESQIEDALDEKKITNITIAEAPIVPLTPNKSNRLLTLILGLSLGLMLAFGSAFVSELLRETFHSPRELQAFTEFPVLATIPLQKSKQRDLSFDHVSAPVDEEEELDFERDDLDESFIRHFYKNKNQVQVQYQED